MRQREQTEAPPDGSGAGFAGVEVLERAPYDFEYKTPRLYAFASR